MARLNLALELMVRFTDAAIRLMQEKPRNGVLSWYVRIIWDNGDANNIRTPDGGTAWAKGPARGWRAEAIPYPIADREKMNLHFESGIPFRVEYTHGHNFPGGVIDVLRDGLILEL